MRTEATRSGAPATPGSAPAGGPGPTVDPALAPPPGHPRFPLLDSLRAIAALAVLGSHVAFISAGPHGPHAWWQRPFTTGVQGVTVFFVISGFLLYRPFVHARLNGAPRARLRDYLRRRALRILPAYWLALTILAIYPGLAGVFTGDWWRYYFLLGGYSSDTISHGLLVSWSLGVEVTFYLLLPLYAAALDRLTAGAPRPRKARIDLAVLGAIAVGSALLRWIDYVRGPHAGIQNSLPAFLLWFALGMALAVVSAELRPRGAVAARLRRAGGWWWIGAIGAYLLLCAVQPEHGSYSTTQWILGYYVLGGLGAAFLVAPAVLGADGGGWSRRILAHPGLAWLGLISYGIYLWHVPVAVTLYDHGVRGFPPLAAATFAVTVACAALSYYLVERPLLTLKR